MMVSKANIGLGIAGFLGIAFLVTGCVLLHVFPGLIHSLVDDQIVLKPGSASYDAWKEPKVPIYFQVWMFDIVNPNEVLKGEKPFVRQIGPYTYREERKKINITFTNNETVAYKETRTFIFDRSKSAGTENDTFCTLNLPMLTVYNMARYQDSFVKKALTAVFDVKKEHFFMTLSVGQLMWGYDDPVLTDLYELVKLLHLNIPIPPKFGLFYGQNGTDDGLYQIYTGEGDVSHFGEILTWNSETKLNIWTSDIANAINGSDGTLYPPYIDTSKTKYLFSSDLCRSLGMDYTEAVSHRGIDMDRFVAPKILFGNAKINPYNAGFCTPAGNCLPSGLLNASVCRQGAPVVMSMPHFLGCDSDIINSVIGLHPNQLEHQSFIDVEPMTGVVMNAGKRLQLNVYMDKIDGFKITNNLRTTFMPLMWLNESALIDKKDADDFKSEVYGKIKLTEAVKYGLIALGSFMLLLVIIILSRRVYHKRAKSVKSVLVNSSNDDALLIANGHNA